MLCDEVDSWNGNIGRHQSRYRQDENVANLQPETKTCRRCKTDLHERQCPVIEATHSIPSPLRHVSFDNNNYFSHIRLKMSCNFLAERSIEYQCLQWVTKSHETFTQPFHYGVYRRGIIHW
jgi:hypothetical protein